MKYRIIMVIKILISCYNKFIKQKGVKIMDNNFNDSMSDISSIINVLDEFGKSAESRMKLEFSDAVKEGETQKQYHLGRCDIGSPWACGTAFDLLEDEEEGHLGD